MSAQSLLGIAATGQYSVEGFHGPVWPAKAAILALCVAVLVMVVGAHEGHDHSPASAPAPHTHNHDSTGTTSAVPSVMVGALMVLVSLLLVFGKNNGS
ncbi:hypothetical protein SAY87_028872 [Trapa incisa]|uniref:Uncharacterized protein n=1 Tax=Trapa incisa TaxID=236973 RepID=A0AAN7QS19_9MYRT|nr:hypothetical protein SAY87_028872 [Trapa incisa]